MLYQLSYAHHKLEMRNGPPERTRTSDPRIRSPLLYPAELQAEKDSVGRSVMVGARGFEPPTPCSQSRCATRLRHAPNRWSVHKVDLKSKTQDSGLTL